MFTLASFVSSRLHCALFATTLAACTGTALTATGNHPGNPEAPSAKLPVIESLKADLADATSPVLGAAGGAHDPGAHDHAAHGHAAHDHAAQGQNDAKPSDDKATRYTCSMHPEVVTNEPGKCPKCGMALIPKKDEK